MFDCAFPFKHHLYSYVSASVSQNYDGTLDGDLRKDLANPGLVDKLLNGREWHELDLFAPLEGRLRVERGRAPRAGEATSWPHRVFRDHALLRKVQHYGDALFSAIGYRWRSSTGYHGCMQHIISEYVDRHGDDADDPPAELYDIYQEFMRSATGSYRAALESNAEAAFPVFTEQTASWHGRVAELRKSAQRRTADAKRRGSISTIGTTPSSTRRIDFGRFANVRVDGAPAGRSRDSDGASSTQSFGGGGGGGADTGTPVKRVNSGPAAMEAESHRVVINAVRRKSIFQTDAIRRARRSNGTHQWCASGLSATKALTTRALPPRLLALATFARSFVCTPIRQATCTLVTRRTNSLRLLGARSTARALRRDCDSQRVAVHRRRPPRSCSVVQVTTPGLR